MAGKAQAQSALNRALRDVEKLQAQRAKAVERQSVANAAVTALDNQILEAQGRVDSERQRIVTALQAQLAAVQGEGDSAA